MKIISIKISSHYAKTFDRLPQRAQRKAIEKIKFFFLSEREVLSLEAGTHGIYK